MAWGGRSKHAIRVLASTPELWQAAKEQWEGNTPTQYGQRTMQDWIFPLTLQVFVRSSKHTKAWSNWAWTNKQGTMTCCEKQDKKVHCPKRQDKNLPAKIAAWRWQSALILSWKKTPESVLCPKPNIQPAKSMELLRSKMQSSANQIYITIEVYFHTRYSIAMHSQANPKLGAAYDQFPHTAWRNVGGVQHNFQLQHRQRQTVQILQIQAQWVSVATMNRRQSWRSRRVSTVEHTLEH